MPSNLSIEQPHWLRNALVSLHHNACVDIHWDNNDHITAETGEPSGEWEINIEPHVGKPVHVKHEDIEHALWYATTLADANANAAYASREAERARALSKLTPGERRLLGVGT